MRPWVGTYDALLLDRHGAVTVGKTVFDAYFKMEKVEHTALSIAAAYAARVATFSA